MDQQINLSAFRRPAPWATQARRLTIAATLFCLLNAAPACAAVEIQGAPDQLRLTVHNASIAEILNALSRRLKLTYKLQSQTSRTVTGNYSGTLRETLARILDGNDYIMELTDAGCRILVLGASPGASQMRPANAAQMAPSTTQIRPSTAAQMPPANKVEPPSNPMFSGVASATVNPPGSASPPPLSSFVSQNLIGTNAAPP